MEKLFDDLPNFGRVSTTAKQLRKDLIKWRKDKYTKWIDETNKAIDDPSQMLKFVDFQLKIQLNFVCFSVWNEQVD